MPGLTVTALDKVSLAVADGEYAANAGTVIDPATKKPFAPPAGFKNAVSLNTQIEGRSEMRDDRLIAAFDQLQQGTHTFSYVVRAVTPGTYQYPSATIECMYDGEVKGRTAASSVVVK